MPYKALADTFYNSSLLTTKESNALLRNYVMKYGYEKINYENLEEDLI